VGGAVAFFAEAVEDVADGDVNGALEGWGVQEGGEVGAGELGESRARVDCAREEFGEPAELDGGASGVGMGVAFGEGGELGEFGVAGAEELEVLGEHLRRKV